MLFHYKTVLQTCVTSTDSDLHIHTVWSSLITLGIYRADAIYTAQKEDSDRAAQMPQPNCTLEHCTCLEGCFVTTWPIFPSFIAKYLKCFNIVNVKCIDIFDCQNASRLCTPKDTHIFRAKLLVSLPYHDMNFKILTSH